MGKYTYICPFTCLLVLLLSGCSSYKDNLQYVDPFIGTDATHFISDWRSEACTYPGAVAPHGIVQISPETSAPGDYLQGYYYSQDTIRRFSMAEHFSGWPDGSHGKGVIMPFTQPGNSEITLRTAASHFSHDREEASPGYYSVYLDDSKIKCRFASLTRSGIGSFIFEGQGERGVILEGVRSLVTINETELELKIASGS